MLFFYRKFTPLFCFLMPRLATSRSALNELLESTRRAHNTVGFVPTMGALHAGHLSLVQQSVAQNATTVVSIFVNPAQFGTGEDFDSYPRTLESDIRQLEQVDDEIIVFAPDRDMVYPERPQISLRVGAIAEPLDGHSRPHFFHGIATVVGKLFNIVRPTRAYFGAKDFQQTLVIRHLIDELFFDIQLVVGETIREPDGLAMSSRNVYLSSAERRIAPELYRVLKRVMAEKNRLDLASATSLVKAHLAELDGLELDYFEVRSATDLRLLERWQPEDAPVAFIAAMLGQTRLIDNLPLYPEAQV